MHYALIKNSKVENVIVANEEFIEEIKSEYDHVIDVFGSRVSAGWIYDNGTFLEPMLPPEPLPSYVAIKFFKLALLDRGLLSKVPEGIQSLESPEKEELEIEWQYASGLEPNSRLAALLQKALKLTNEDITDLFVLASKK